VERVGVERVGGAGWRSEGVREGGRGMVTSILKFEARESGDPVA
jgi:hypothetical protein